MFRVFIGFDPRQPVAYHVCASSVARHASKPVSITPLILSQLPIKRRGLTEFTYSRYLVPYLCNYEGFALFIDSDVVVLGDVHELALEHQVSVVQCPRQFEWPSVMLFDNPLNTHVTPEFVESADMFSFAWANDLGKLPPEWNHLVGYDPPQSGRKLLHYTKGIPVWPETRGSDYAVEWFAEWNYLRSTCSYDALMGNSVHVQR